MREFAKFIFYWLALILDCLVKLATTPDTKNGSKKSICFVRVDGIGDSLMWLDTCKELYKYYDEQGYALSLICAAPCKVLYVDIFDKDQIMEVSISQLYKFKYRWNALKSVRKNNYDIIINFAYSRAVSIESILRVSSAKKKLGNSGDAYNMPKTVKNWTDKLYTHLAPQFEVLSDMKKNGEFAKWLGLSTYTTRTATLSSSFINENMVEGDYFVVVPGSALTEKCWPVERFADCCNVIMEKAIWKLVICGGKKEIPTSEKLLSLIDNKYNVVDLTGQTSLAQLSSTIAKSKFILTNDTGALHFAVALGVPNVGIAKACAIGRFVPYPEDIFESETFLHKIIYNERACTVDDITKCSTSGSPYPCIAQIATDTVLAEINLFLNEMREKI